MCSTDYDPAEFYNRCIIKKSKKNHVCDECHRVIQKTEGYSKSCGKWNGTFDTFKTCSNCLVFQDWLLKECGGFMHGGLLEEIDEHAHEYSKMFLYRGLIGLRRKWKNKKGNLINKIIIKM